MNKLMWLTLIFLCLTPLLSAYDTINLSQDDLNNPQLMKVLNNYFGCKTWVDGVCTECSQNFYFNTKGICCAVTKQCEVFNKHVGICQQCYQGYEIVNGNCVAIDLSKSKDKGCNKWANGACMQCSVRWYFDAYRVCQPVDPNCRSWTDAGQCNTCYNGYVAQNGACVRDVNEFTPAKDSLCAQWKDRVCLKCSPRAFFDKNGVCKAVSNYCNTWDQYEGACLTCYAGYVLNQRECAPAKETGPKDLGCKKWNWDNQVCLECSSRWVMGVNGICLPISDICSAWDTNGYCKSCYKGYNLSEGTCVLAHAAGPKDQGCKQWDWNNQICLECSARWVMGTNGVCIPVNDVCSAWDTNGYCKSCYKGYNLANGVCILAPVTGPKDLGCAKWDWNNQVCLECSARWMKGANGACVPVSDQCSSWNAQGVCVACYKGYVLYNGQCVVAQQTGPKDLGCKRWDWDKQICLECSTRWTLNANGVCAPVNNACSTWDAYGVCTACYKGYSLRNEQCIVAQQSGPKDLGCKTWDWDRQICLACSERWTLGTNGVCVPVNDQCLNWNVNGVCTACYKGYGLKNGVCTLLQPEGPKDLGCKKWDWDKKVCIECSARWVMGHNGVCVPISDVCSAWDANGYCKACYKGYNLVDGACVLAPVTGPKDLGCAKWDWNSQICLECSARWVKGPNGVCAPVADQCSNWNTQGICTTCYKGYALYNGQCIVAQQTGPKDLGCKTWDWDNQRCLQCSARWAFGANGVCVPVSDFCAAYDKSGVCTACYNGYALQNGQCQVQNVLCKTTNNDSTCKSCYTGYVLYRSQCVPISKLASLAQYYAECCPDQLAILNKEGRLNY